MITATLRGHDDINWSAAFSPAGRALASTSDMVSLVWDVATARKNQQTIFLPVGPGDPGKF
ncbi:hypothetical protein [Streptosporangium canum]|uniref:hypothetical protein n=1 Tax=Streptosporangium canum TaxID=324952 RepID=UPI00341C423C